MGQALADQRIETELGTFRVAFRPGKTLVVFLNGASSFETEQTFRPVIDRLPPQTGILVVDYINHGLSSLEKRAFNLEEEAGVILKIIQQQGAQRILLVAHSLGGVYALHIAQKLNNLIGFVGIEPMTREIILDPPHSGGYQAEIEAAAKMTEKDVLRLFKRRVERYFPPSLAQQIWETSLADERRSDPAIEQRQSADYSAALKRFPNLKLSHDLPVTIFARDFREAEYRRSEYFTEKWNFKPYGSFHYVHWEYPGEIRTTIEELLVREKI
ncbi:alpha/beta hydrolase [Ligilactobacillus salitolerans]|uniref:Alpha/beta hydrolase n=1 Tax=Ligilactobacillus salitolerans TaxID=1808352 RepID=A0A401IPW9_9LACO|nr:alpha/beta hydrolase [Ligilactobacillus salitolerans]GBG93579.1 alpha/beta hydrolase [Ligilactobacillus salitolerans]